MGSSDVKQWFVREVLPLEAALMQFLQRNWRNQSEIADIRQEVYVRVYEAAQREIPEHAKPFVLTTARNILINRVRREQVVPIEAVADLESLGAAADEPPPDRAVITAGFRALERRLEVGTRITAVAGKPEAAAGGYLAKPYQLVDVFANFKVNERTTASLTLTNIFDTEYTQYLNGQPSPGFGAKFTLAHKFSAN